MAKVKAIDRLEAVEAHAAATGNPHGLTPDELGVYPKERVYQKDQVYTKTEIDKIMGGGEDIVGGLTTREIITASGDWTAPRTTIFFVFLVSGGGSGGGGSSFSARGGGGGGGSGAIAMLVSFLEKDQSLSLSIGAGGPIAQGTGSSGGETSLTVGGRTYAAPGGSGGGIAGSNSIGLGGASGGVTGRPSAGFFFSGHPGVSGSNGGSTAGPGGDGFDVYGDGSMMFGAGGKGGYGASSKGSPGTQGCVVIMY